MGKILTMGAGGGGVGSDELTAKASDVREGMLYVGSDTNDEAGTGTLKDNKAWTGSVGRNTSIWIPDGIHAGSKVNGPKMTDVAGKTVAPTESEQTAVASGSYVTGDIKVGAISKTYVGSGVTKQAAKTVTPSESEQTAVPANVYTTGAVKVGAISKTHVGSGVTRQAGKTITPSTAKQTVSCNGKLMTGDIVVNAIPSNYYDSTNQPAFFKNGSYGPLAPGGAYFMSAAGASPGRRPKAYIDPSLFSSGILLTTYAYDSTANKVITFRNYVPRIFKYIKIVGSAEKAFRTAPWILRLDIYAAKGILQSDDPSGHYVEWPPNYYHHELVKEVESSAFVTIDADLDFATKLSSIPTSEYPYLLVEFHLVEDLHNTSSGTFKLSEMYMHN